MSALPLLELLELHGQFPGFSYRSSGAWCDMYAAHDVRTYATACALAAVEDYRASQVPMTDVEVASLLHNLRGEQCVGMVALIRAVEARHNIGVTK